MIYPSTRHASRDDAPPDHLTPAIEDAMRDQELFEREVAEALNRVDMLCGTEHDAPHKLESGDRQQAVAFLIDFDQCGSAADYLSEYEAQLEDLLAAAKDEARRLRKVQGERDFAAQQRRAAG